MDNSKYIKLTIKSEDHPYIAEAFAYAIAFFANDRVHNTRKESTKRAKNLAEVAGRINGAEIEFL